jgi:hypothetical protein
MTKCQAWTGCALVLLLSSSVGTAVAADSPAATDGSESSAATNVASESSADEGSAQSQQSGLAEIIVTAQRSESINKVDLAIAALSGETLKDMNIHSVGLPLLLRPVWSSDNLSVMHRLDKSWRQLVFHTFLRHPKVNNSSSLDGSGVHPHADLAFV